MTGWMRRAPLLALLLLTALVYWPGLKGPFLFDDFANLPLLHESGPLDRAENVIRYLLSGFAGPTGRPVAMASFMPEAASWPNDPFPFKRTNLILHLINAALLAAVVHRLLKAWAHPRARAIAIVTAGVWALHPLWVSTTLYVIQRMALLATLFSLLGILMYLEGRRRIVAKSLSAGLGFMFVGVYGMGLLAALSKENGALLPLLLLVLERYGLANAPPLPRPARRWAVSIVGAPAAAVVAYLVSQLPLLATADAGLREFTPWQRLLTEGRVIVGYLGALLLPRIEGGGLYASEVPLATGLFSPWHAALPWLGLIAAWGVAERYKHVLPGLALAITFFLAGHLLESTWLPLELAFEHRNYLPAVFLPLPLALGIARLPDASRRWTIVGLLGLLAAMTLLRADLWGRPFALALTWAESHPDSPRAILHLAALWRETGNHEQATQLLKPMAARQPHDLLLAANRLLTACESRAPIEDSVRSLADALAAAPARTLVARLQLRALLDELRSGHCAPADQTAFERLWQAAWDQPRQTAATRALLLEQRALLRLAEGRHQEAGRDYLSALNEEARPDAQLAAAAALASHGAFDEALAVLDHPLPREDTNSSPIAYLRAAWNARSGYWERERVRLRQTILADRSGALPRPAESANVATP